MATEVLVPPLGQTVDTVTLVQWYKAEGEQVNQGEPLFAIETDKATLDVEAPASGVLWGVSCAPGTEVAVLTRIAFIVAPGEVLAKEPGATSPLPEKTIAQVASEPQAEAARRPPGGQVFISPRARRLAAEHDIPLDALQGTGPEGAIVEQDVRAYLEREPARPTAAEEVLERLPLSGVRAIIAERMARSASTTASVTLTAEADATALVELREQLLEDGVQVSYNDLFLYILGRALRGHPGLNASLVGDAITLWKRIHVGVAVDTDRSLVVPVVRDVDRKGLAQIAQETRALIEAAQEGKIAPDDLKGQTFTLTNLGMYGIDAFTPIINLPDCAILGVGRIKTQPVWAGDHVKPRQMVWLSLTFDHRLVDGGPAARFLQRVVQLVEKPHLLMA
ncbi:MAG: 2-oxo acid dehydrogenase subunit E2 [Chloroflexi bacterium HGW-Chloroflexi-1]|nr:MAG: 2-oxo acid dehydrogenase subunit E2 [Chloroflexi bacterium HGW-Chloroflexi-1]